LVYAFSPINFKLVAVLALPKVDNLFSSEISCSPAEILMNYYYSQSVHAKLIRSLESEITKSINLSFKEYLNLSCWYRFQTISTIFLIYSIRY